MASVTVARGPLDHERLGWVAELYGAADAKYRDPSFLAHMFVDNPSGPVLHAFGVEGDRAVGHVAVVPIPARYGDERLRSGKVEALFVAPTHRGRRGRQRALVLDLVEALYATADADGIDPLHAFVLPRVGRVLGLAPAPLGNASLVTVLRPSSVEHRRAATAALAAAQWIARTPARVARRSRANVRPPAPEDIDLVAAEPPADRWTIVADDVWDWYRASPLLRILELDDVRALAQLPHDPGDPLRLVSWRSSRPGLGAAFSLVAAAERLARETGAGTIRFQPWPGAAGNGALARACRLAGFVSRRDFTTLYMRSQRPELVRAGSIVPTPFFFLGF